MSEVVEEVVEPVLETVMEEAHSSPLKFVMGGLFAGLAIGGGVGYFLTKRQLETKFNQIAEEEIEEMRQHFRDKELALENTQAKPRLEEIVKERGYSSEPPMAVTPPDSVVDRAQEIAEEEPGDPRPPVPVVREETQNVFQKEPPTKADLGVEPVVDDWNYERERARRTPRVPYVVHVDEVTENEEYDSITYTYYEEDDVLCNERDEVIDKVERDELIGEANLNKFGHGSMDATKVYIRNDRLEMQMEVIRSPNSYAEEVHGFQHSHEYRHGRRERRSIRDE